MWFGPAESGAALWNLCVYPRYSEDLFFSEWTSAPWQVLLGQVGFFDQFTVTFSRSTLQLAIEDAEGFDKRYGTR